MPTYVFEEVTDKEEKPRHELVLTFTELNERQFTPKNRKGQFIVHENVMMKRVYLPFSSHATSIWPKKSIAAGVGIDQIGEATAHDRKHGVPTDYNSDGDAIYTSLAHQRKHCKLHGLVDRDSYL